MTPHRLGALATTAALAAAGGLLTATPASAAVSCTSPAGAAAAAVHRTSPVWTAQYFANTSFSGTPRLTACDGAIAENYGTGDPAGVTLPHDNFSVRWSVTRDFGSGGPFAFSAATQDGIRVYLDGVRVIDLWRNVSTTQTRTVDVAVPAGRHTLRVEYVAFTGTANVAFSYAPRTSPAVDTVAPRAPLGASATYDRATDRATLRWAPNTEMDLAGYRVYRRLATTAWTRVSGDTPVTGRSFSDSPPTTGESFLYEVRAVDKAGNESAGSVDGTVTSTDRTAPAAPDGLTATDRQAGVTLAWRAVPGASTYTVFRRRVPDTDVPTSEERVATVTSPTWTDSAVTERAEYTYWVAAVDAAGNTSPRTWVAATHRDYTAPAAPTGLTAVFQPRNGVVVSWTPSTSKDVARYRVYRFGELYTETGYSSYTDMSVGHGTTYTYTVTAVDEAGNESPVSGAASATTHGDLVAPAAVTGLKATPREDGVLLEWEPNTEPDLKRYEVFKAVRHEDGEGGYVWLAHRVEYLAEDATSFLHGSAADGETVMYGVFAVDDWNNVLRVEDETVNWVDVTELGTPDAG
ncbi:PA14 domain-containing protein [Streptomyces sp. NPDC057430]|uniref:PA14 domain-containing protein n=1 Tax=Streptomyces sp. NPDC057430 TaxID=3346131 RepID=UPI0036A9709C